MKYAKLGMKDRLEVALLSANKYGLEEVNLEYNPKKLKALIKEVLLG